MLIDKLFDNMCINIDLFKNDKNIMNIFINN